MLEGGQSLRLTSRSPMYNDCERISCPVCEAANNRGFFSQCNVPTRAGLLAASKEEAIGCPLGDINLRHCRECGHIWNCSFDPEKLGFDTSYDFSQYFSDVYREYVVRSINRLKARYSLEGKTALDIACGKGDYLKLLVKAGLAKGIGFDPTYVEEDLEVSERSRIKIHKKYFGPEDGWVKTDIVTCRSALQYMPRPRGILQTIRLALMQQKDTIVYFEVPNGAEAFREKIVWYVMYEAGCFFSTASLARLFRECGFQVLDILPALGSSHLEVEARPSETPGYWDAECDSAKADIERQVDDFANEYTMQTKAWSERFDDYHRSGRRVALWAAGMRAISLLVNVPSAGRHVECVVDINPQRQGKFLPKTGQMVIDPESLRSVNPDIVIATNPNYAEEIAQQVKDLGLKCQFEILR